MEDGVVVCDVVCDVVDGLPDGLPDNDDDGGDDDIDVSFFDDKPTLLTVNGELALKGGNGIVG